MAKRKIPKRRAPGGGRKPQGEVSGLREVMSFRLPTEMRGDLEKAAKENDRSITQELLHRLEWSFREDRKNYRDPAVKALCFLFSELADYVHRGTPDWRSDPFLWSAFKLAASKLLDGLPEPTGKIETPLLLKSLFDQLSKDDDPTNNTSFVRNWRAQVARIMKSPEALADFAATSTLAAFFKPSQSQSFKDWEPWREELDADPDMPGIGSKFLRYQQNVFYGNDKARRDLSLKRRRQ